MPKNAKIPTIVRREWLLKYELGAPIIQIAREAGRDVRTIKKYIELAQKEADLRASRQNLLTKALDTHNDKMLRVVENIVQALEVPDSKVELRRSEKDEWLDIPLNASTGKQTPEGLRIVLHDEDSVIWELLGEHLGTGSPLGHLPMWKMAMVEYLEVLRHFILQIEDTLVIRTGLEIIKEKRDLPGKPTLFTALPEMVFPIFVNRITGARDETNPEHNLKRDKDGYISLHGSGTHLAWDNDENSPIITHIEKVLVEIGQSQEIKNLMSQYTETRQITKKIRDDFEEIKMIEYVAGTCRVCDRLGK